MTSPADTVSAYLDTLFDPDGAPEDIGPFLHPDLALIEHPNAIAPTGNRRGRVEAIEGARAGRRLMRWQTLEDRRVAIAGDEVVVRGTWRGELADDAGALPAGGLVTAHLAMFFSVVDGRIVRQENFDCYEPLPRAVG